VRYHVVEIISSFVSFVENGDGIRYEPQYQFGPSMRLAILEQVCEEIIAVLGLGSEHSVEQDETGFAYRAYSMFWPLVVLLFSSLVDEEKRSYVQEKLRFIGKMSGLGLATLAAGSIDTLRPV
jgi:hypothetical protein